MTPPVMLFAAGFGTRMGALTRDRPKPLINVAGRPLIDHALALVTGAGLPRVVVNAHYMPDMIEAHLADRPVQVIRETPDILETGGGLRNALPYLNNETVITLNSDAVWAGPNPLSLLIDAWDPDRMDALLLCVPMARVHGRQASGDFTVRPDGQLLRGPDTVYAGAQILKTDRLHDVPDAAFSLNVVWNAMAADARLFGMTYPGHWCDVGHPDGIAEAEAMLATHHV